MTQPDKKDNNKTKWLVTVILTQRFKNEIIDIWCLEDMQRPPVKIVHEKQSFFYIIINIIIIND